MKILIINSVCGRQSTGKIVSDIQGYLLENGHECVIAYGEKNSKKTEGNYKIGHEYDRYIHGIMSRITDKHGLYSSHPTKNLIDFIEQYNPDIVHLHNVHGYYVNVKMLAEYLIKTKRKVIWTLHDCWTFTGHCAYFGHAHCSKWKSQCEECPQKKEYPRSLLMDNSKYNFNLKKELFTKLDVTFVTPSQWLADLLKESFLKEKEVVVIPNGIDKNIFKPSGSDILTKYKIPYQRYILGVASIWDERKGLKDFIRLSGLLPQDEGIVLVGLSKEQIQSLPANIIGIQHTDNQKDLAALYSSAQYFFIPSYEDNFPTVILESLSCGTPVISYRTGGCCEAITPDCGFIVDQGDVEAVSSIIKNEMVPKTNACVAASKEYSIEVFTAKYLDLYNKEL